MNVADAFDLRAIERLADRFVYARGVVYRSEGRVERPVRTSERIAATVRGTVPYRVELWVDEGELAWSCTCPYAEGGAVCKHAVAVALSDDPVGPPLACEEAEPIKQSRATDLASYVEGLPRERLAEIVLEQCESDWKLEERLGAEARAAHGDVPNIASWVNRLTAVFAPWGDHVSYREVDRWADDIFDVVDGLVGLADTGHNEAVVLLTEHGHRCVSRATHYVDDADGRLGDIEDRLIRLHQAACEVSLPDPIALAHRLVDLELTSMLDGFTGAAATYREVLGEEGIGEYRRLLIPRWESVKGLSLRGEDDRSRVEEAMIGVAIASSDPDELIRVLSERQLDLLDYSAIARALSDVGRTEEAVSWGQRGLDEWASLPNQTGQLRELLAEVLENRGAHEQALQVLWDGFVSGPSLKAYRSLLVHAGDDSRAWSELCIETLAARLTDGDMHEGDPPSPSGSGIAAPLVQILMYEGDPDRAWAVVSEHGASDRVWWDLAREREAAHPLDSIAVYGPKVLALIEQRNRTSYRSAVQLLAHIQLLADAARSRGVFDDLVERVRTEHRAKWTLMEMLDRKQW